MHILSPVTDNCSSWISGRGRMAVEMFSWPNLHERMCRTWGSNSGPLACQANSLPIELPRLMFWYVTIWQQFAIFHLLTEKISCIKNEFIRSYPLLKIPTFADPAHVSDVMYVLCFVQVTEPIISSRLIRFQVEQTNNIIALAVFMFILNISVEQT